MKVPPIAYVTPVLRYDAEARVTVLQYRDADNGKVTRQIPGEQAIKAYRAETAGLPGSTTAPSEAPSVDDVKPSPALPAAAPDLAAKPTISLKA